MKQYLQLMEMVASDGAFKADRTGTGTHSIFGHQMRFDLQPGAGFPLLTTKKLNFKSILHELLFFLNGDTNNNVLIKNGVSIWNEWSDSNGNLGPIYSHQWRRFGADPSSVPQRKGILPVGVKANILEVAFNDAPSKLDGVDAQLLSTWKGMISRCYNRNKDTYCYYGKIGVSVCDRWLVFSQFREDAKKINGWDMKCLNWADYQLDKDVLGTGFLYSPESCMWATRSENQQAKYQFRHVIRHDDGSVAIVENPVVFYNAMKLHQGNFSSMLRGDRKKAQGWSLVKTENINAGIDQIANVVAMIKSNPDSRRLIVSAWNPSQIDQTALPPCHTLFQFYVSNGRLSCQLYQRSADIFLGVPFNIASYALLTMMIAQVCGLEAGEFIWTGGDCHLYLNHHDQVNTQLARFPSELPTVRINPDVKDIFGFKFEDFELLDYFPQSHIKAPVAV